MKYESKYLLHTHTGKLVDPFQLHPEDIDIRDIAHSLARICRYNGHVRSLYSVAEHSVRVSEIAESRTFNQGRESQLMGRYGLLHDATEAYLGDVVRSIKVKPEMEWYRAAEAKLEEKILTKHRLGPTLPTLVLEIDREICGTEMRQLLEHAVDVDGTPLKPCIPGLVVGLWSPEEAETRFLARFHELF